MHTHKDLLASPQVVELPSGVVAVYLCGRSVLADGLVEFLEEKRQRAVEAAESVPIHRGKHQLRVEPFVCGKHRFRITHKFGLIGVTPSQRLPTFRVQAPFRW